MDNLLKQNLISSAILAGDEIVFSYRKPDDDNLVVIRYATPIKIDGDTVHCAQHLPEEGFRNFKLDRIDSLYRVASRMFFPTVYQKEPQA